LLASDQPRHIVETICHRVMEHLGCQVFLNFLVDEQIGRLRLDSCAGIPEETARQIESLDYCVAVCGHPARNECRSVLEDIQSASEVQTDFIRGCGLQAYACHPLMNQEQIVGTLSFGTREKRTFSEEELGLMKAVADLVAIAMQRIRLLESLARHARAAEAANEAKSQFLASMSHELRTPMNAILGMIDVALPKAADLTVRDCLQTAKGSADILLTLLNDLLDSAKIESGKLELEAAPFSLRKMMDQVTRTLSVRACEKGLSFCCRVPEDTPDALVGDRMRLQQVLFNVAGNAIKFTDRGKVQIDLRTLSKDREACLEFAVKDTGIGITVSTLPRLFQPFVQADATTARRYGGSGLGLSIAQNLVEMMQGRIWVDSSLDQGSTFYFTVRLPVWNEPMADTPPPAAVPSAATTSLRILLAEDNAANRKLVRYILQDRGHVVDCAADGHEALCLNEQNRYDAILMDVQMPNMDGHEAAMAIRRRENGAHRVPIIALTAYAMQGDRERCLAAGMDSYLAKPINAHEMIRLIESLGHGASSKPSTTIGIPNPLEQITAAGDAVFCFEEALLRCFHNENRVWEMIQYFFDEVDFVLAQMHAALEKRDLPQIGQLAHRIKGTLVYLGAPSAANAAQNAERFCKSNDGTPAEAEEAIQAVQQACEILKTALANHPRVAKLAQGH
jgi:signal transduction histidine kinase/CheY-like chemotaxis protein